MYTYPNLASLFQLQLLLAVISINVYFSQVGSHRGFHAGGAD